MDLYFDFNVHKVWTISVGNLRCDQYSINTYYNLVKLIPIEWQLILMSDGSFTQNLISLTGNIIQVKIVSQSMYKLDNYNKKIREIWLIDQSYNKLAFAQSIWPKYDDELDYTLTQSKKPIGQSFVESQADIYRDIHEIYCGYCKNLDNEFQFDDIVWGRKYTIYSNNKPLTTIHEIFSPQIIDFFVPFIPYKI